MTNVPHAPAGHLDRPNPPVEVRLDVDRCLRSPSVDKRCWKAACGGMVGESANHLEDSASERLDEVDDGVAAQ
jgi:hypothetical protein